MMTPFTPAALRALRDMAGNKPVAEIAHVLGWSVAQVQRVAREHGYDLSLSPRTDAITVRLPIDVLDRFRRRAARNGNTLEEQIAHALEHEGSAA